MASPWRIVFSRHGAGLDELEQVVGTAGLGARPGQAVAAERLAPDDRPGDPAIDVQIAHRGAARGRNGRCPDRARTARRSARTAARRRGRTPPPRPHRLDRSAAGRRSPRAEPGSPAGRSATTVGAANHPSEGTAPRARHDPPLLPRLLAVAAQAVLGVALDQRGHLGRQPVGLPDDEHRGRAGQPLGQRVGDRLVPPAHGLPPSTSDRRRQRPRRRSPARPRRGRRRRRRSRSSCRRARRSPA